MRRVCHNTAFKPIPAQCALKQPYVRVLLLTSIILASGLNSPWALVCFTLLRRTLFGSDIAPLHSPGFARNFMRLLRREGGIVFTNGDLDGWAGGSLGVNLDSLKGQKGISKAEQGQGHAEGVHVSSLAADGAGAAAQVHAALTSVNTASANEAAGAGTTSASPAVGSSSGSDSSSSSIASRARGKPPHKAPKQRPSREEPEHRPPGHYEYHEHEQQQHEHEQQQQQHHYQHPEEEDQGDATDKAGSVEKVAFITYKNASHCTDTHTYAWQTPGEPAEWKQQRAEAMDRAVAFATPARLAVLRDLRADPLLPLVPESEEAS